MGRIRGDQDIQVQGGNTSSIAGRSIFAERRVHINQYWKEEEFESLYHALLMCEIVYPYKSKAVRLACAGALNDIE